LSMDEVWIFRTFLHHDEMLSGALPEKDFVQVLDTLGLPDVQDVTGLLTTASSSSGSSTNDDCVAFAVLLRWWWARDADLYSENPAFRVKMGARSAWLAFSTAMFGESGLPTIVTARLRFLAWQAIEACESKEGHAAALKQVQERVVSSYCGAFFGMRSMRCQMELDLADGAVTLADSTLRLCANLRTDLSNQTLHFLSALLDRDVLLAGALNADVIQV
jgi:hypothetical protein